MRIRKFLPVFFLVIIAAFPVFAQVKFSTVVGEKEYGKDDYIQVEYIVENASSVEALTPPTFPGFTVVSGPMQQSGMSIINGATSKYEGITYVLKPSATGKFTIAGATATVDGKQMRSNTVAVVITNAPARQQNPISGNPFQGLMMPEEIPEVNEEYVLRKGESASEKIKNNLIVKLDVSKTTCYQGEPIVATYRLYSRLKSESRVSKRPSLSQFSVYDMVQPEANNPTIEKINGKLFNAHIIRKVQLYPLQDGSFELDPVEVDNTVRFLRLEAGSSKTSMQQLLDDYMNGVNEGRMEEQKITLSSKPVTITVKPLPEAGKPASFDGAVGRFTISASIPQTAIAAGETALLNVILKGQGNLTLINAPQVQWPQHTEGFEPSVKEHVDKTVSPISGTKMFQYSFTAKLQGRIIIPPVEFSYFDPAANAYKTIRTDSIVADIGPAERKAKPLNSIVDNNKAIPVSWVNWLKLLWLLPILAVGVLAVYFNRKKRNYAKKELAVIETQVVNEQPANIPPDPFEAARHALIAINSQLFYKETGRAVWQLLSEKFSLLSSQLNKPVVMRLMQETKASAETIQLLESVLNDCELALYTPVHTENDMRQTLEKAEKLAEALSGELRATS